MILEMTIGAIDQSPRYTTMVWAFLFSESVVAEMIPTTFSGEGSFATAVAGQGSVGASGVTGTGQFTFIIFSPFESWTLIDSTADFAVDGVTAGMTLRVQGATPETYTIALVSNVALKIPGTPSPTGVDLMYSIDELAVGIAGTGSSGAISGTGGV